MTVWSSVLVPAAGRCGDSNPRYSVEASPSNVSLVVSFTCIPSLGVTMKLLLDVCMRCSLLMCQNTCGGDRTNTSKTQVTKFQGQISLLNMKSRGWIIEQGLQEAEGSVFGKTS